MLQSDDIARCDRCGCGGCDASGGTCYDPLGLGGTCAHRCVLHGDSPESLTQQSRDDLIHVHDCISLELLRNSDESGRVVVCSQCQPLEHWVGLCVGGKVVSFRDQNSRDCRIISDWEEHVLARCGCDGVAVSEHWRRREHCKLKRCQERLRDQFRTSTRRGFVHLADFDVANRVRASRLGSHVFERLGVHQWNSKLCGVWAKA